MAVSARGSAVRCGDTEFGFRGQMATSYSDTCGHVPPGDPAPFADGRDESVDPPARMRQILGRDSASCSGLMPALTGARIALGASKRERRPAIGFLQPLTRHCRLSAIAEPYPDHRRVPFTARRRARTCQSDRLARHISIRVTDSGQGVWRTRLSSEPGPPYSGGGQQLEGAP